MSATSATYLACVRKSPLLMNSPARAKMLPPLLAPKSYQRFFSGFTLKDGVRSSRYGDLYQMAFALRCTG